MGTIFHSNVAAHSRYMKMIGYYRIEKLPQMYNYSTLQSQTEDKH